MPILTVRHLTRYRYRNPVAFGEHRMMMRPQEAFDQRLLSYDLHIAPQPCTLREVGDAFGNCITLAAFNRKWPVLEVESRFTMDHRPAFFADRRGGLITGPMATPPFAYDAEEAPDLARCIVGSGDQTVAAFAMRFVSPVGPTPLLHALAEMTGAIRADFTYGRRLTGAAQSAAETLAKRTGACRDFAVLMMDAARSLGLAARFVSGYVVSGTLKSSGAPRLGGGHTHAWLQVYLPELGWVDFDPTNGIVGSQGLIRVATVRDPAQANVLSGEYDGEDGDFLGMDVEVDVVEVSPADVTEPNVRVAA